MLYNKILKICVIVSSVFFVICFILSQTLADKLSKTVVKTGKQVTLEPMSAYERKIIHNRLQNSEIVKKYIKIALIDF